MVSTHKRNLAARLRRNIRKRLVFRNMAWSIARSVFDCSPTLRRAYAIYTRTVPVDSIGRRVASETARSQLQLDKTLDEYLTSYPTSPLSMYDGGDVLQLRKTLQIFEVRDCCQMEKSGHIAHLLTDSIVEWGLRTPSRDPGKTARYIGKQKPHRYRAELAIKGTCITAMVGPPRYTHYGHFLLQTLRWLIYIIDNAPDASDATILARDTMPEFQRKALDALFKRHPGLKLQTVEAHTRVHCERLLLPLELMPHEICWFSSRAELVAVRDLYLEAHGHAPTETERKLYISRNRYKLRRVNNQDDVQQTLERYGFERIEPETLAHHQQIEAFSAASHIFAPSGSAIANVIFCQPATHVILTGPRDIHEPFWIALILQMGLDFSFLPGSPSGSRESFSVDIQSLRQCLSANAT